MGSPYGELPSMVGVMAGLMANFMSIFFGTFIMVTGTTVKRVRSGTLDSFVHKHFKSHIKRTSSERTTH